MCQNRNSVLCSLKHTLAIHLSIHDRLSILADRRDSGFHHSLDIRKFLSLLSLRDRANLQYMNAMSALCLLMHIFYNIRIVDNRLRIRHRKHRRISTVCSCRHTGEDILFLLKSRITKMHMHIDKSRHHITSLCLNHAIRLAYFQVFSYLCDLVLFNSDIRNLIHLRCRIDHMTAFNQYTHLFRLSLFINHHFVRVLTAPVSLPSIVLPPLVL